MKKTTIKLDQFANSKNIQTIDMKNLKGLKGGVIINEDLEII